MEISKEKTRIPNKPLKRKIHGFELISKTLHILINKGIRFEKSPSNSSLNII